MPKNPQAATFFSPEDQQRLVQAVKLAERKTSGEIRLYLEDHCLGGDAYARGRKLFERHGMTRTELRNGVLFYLAVVDHKFAVLGDKGIHEHVPAGYWDGLRDRMREHFRNGRFTQGLEEAILDVGQYLGKAFPYQKDDVNELPDDILFGDHHPDDADHPTGQKPNA